MLRKVEVRAVTAAARAELAGEQADYREPRPLAKAERLEQLPFGVFDGKRDGVDGGNRQSAPQFANRDFANGLAARYCETRRRSNQFGRFVILKMLVEHESPVLTR